MKNKDHIMYHDRIKLFTPKPDLSVDIGYIDTLWFRTNKNNTLYICEKINDKNEYDGECIFDEELDFSQAAKSDHYIIVPVVDGEPGCGEFVVLDLDLEIKAPKITSYHWRYGKTEYERYDKS